MARNPLKDSASLVNSESSSDPASSLRAAALLTLKSKRRKPPSGQSSALPPRLVPIQNHVQLDYGEEDLASTSQAPSVLESSSSLVSPIAPSPDVDMASSEIEDGQIREEGEISDTEGTAPLPSNPPQVQTNAKLATTTRRSGLSRAPSPRSTHLTKTDSPPEASSAQDPDRYSLSALGGPSNPTKSLSYLIAPSGDTPFVDADHVRPGLAMTQETYDMAKDAILDLLGWGVPPEYLVDCGLSREIVYYVFSEFNLRLPSNLDLTGLVSYSPDRFQSILALSNQGEAMNTQNSGTTAVLSRNPARRLSHPSLPPKPEIHPLAALDASGLSNPTHFSTAPPTSSSSTTEQNTKPTSMANSSTSLHDMEKQRRQELLARKAVQASRKPKRTVSASNEEPSERDVEMATIIPSETVEDFLKSIEPITPNDEENKPNTSNVNKPEQMDVDDAIRGLPSTFSETWRGPDESFSVASNFTSPVEDSLEDLAPPTSAGPPPSSTESGWSAHTTTSASSLSTRSSNGTNPTARRLEREGSTSAFQRRGTKRAVAADFVDFEPGNLRSGSSNGYANSGGHHTANAHVRRKYGEGSFASVSGMRRCVIDLSDSEDDGVAEGGLDEYERGVGSSRRRSPVQGVPPYGAWATPTPPNAPPITIVTSPGALLQKESEIKRMRELIAQREEIRLKKLAALSSKTSLGSVQLQKATATLSVETLTAVKQEDEEPAISVALRSNSSVSSGSNAHAYRSATPIQSVPTIPIPDVARSSSSTSSSSSSTHPIGDAIGLGAPVAPHAKMEEGDEAKPRPRSGSLTSTNTNTLEDVELQEMLVDADGASSSAQISNSQDTYPAYHSLFESYPLLHSCSRALFSGDQALKSATHVPAYLSYIPSSSYVPYSSLAPSSSSSSRNSTSYDLPSSSSRTLTRSHKSSFAMPNLNPLKLATRLKALEDPSKQLCRYEVPGGGVCRDEGCEDLHLSRVGAVEPNDQDTAQYLFNLLPRQWRDACSVQKIYEALQALRRQASTAMSLEELARSALAAVVTLGSINTGTMDVQ